jgi:tape measure domain-containing protein
MAYDGTLRFDTSMDASGFQKGASGLDDIVKGLGVFKLLEKGFQMVAASVDQAVARYDTLNRFPKVMESMGYGADNAEASIKKLSSGIQGLPTTLDGIVSSTQRLVVILGNLDEGTNTALALNNAFLAGSATAEQASRGTEQYIQALAKGKPDMMEWRTLLDTMPFALQKLATAFGFTGADAVNQLGEALRSGEITMTEFNAKLIELNGGVDGFAALAKTATGGIGTAWTNMQTAVVRGVTGIISSIDEGLSATRFKSIENVISSTGKAIETILKALAAAFGFVASKADILLPAIVAVSTAFAAYKIIGTVTAAFTGFTSTIKAAQAVLTASQGLIMMDVASHTLLTAALASETTAQAVRTAAKTAGMTIDAAGNLITSAGTAATAAETASVLASAGALSAKTVIVGVLTGGISIATAAQWVWNAAMAANPIGLIVAVVILAIAAIAALVVGIMALIGALKGESEAYKAQKKEMEKLSKAHKEYEKQLKEEKTAADQAITKTKAQADANNDLVSNLRNLMATNDKAGSNNEAIARTVDQLNKSVGGLGLSYDETTQKLSAGIKEVEAYVKAQGELAVIKAQEDEYNRLLGEQLEIQAKIRVEEERQKILAQQLDDKTISQKEYNKLVKQSDDLIKEYGKTEAQLSTDIQAAYAAIDTAAKDSATAQVNAYDAIHGARDAEGNNLRQLAKLYGTTTDEILAEMEKHGLTMAEWSAKKAEGFTKEGQSLQGVANQWGMTTDEVIAYMDEWGMTLDEFVDELQATHTKEGLSLEQLADKWGTTADAIKSEMDSMGISMQEWSDQQQEAWADYEASVKERTEGVINSFKKIPGEYDKSAKEMLDILINNKERYAEWESAMEEITRQLGPTAAEEFAKLGPEATSAMQEILDSAEMLDQYRDVFGVKLDEVTGLAVEDWNDPNFIGAPSGAIDTSAQMVTQNPALADAVTGQMEGARAAAEAVDFSAVGQNIATDIAGAITGETGKVTAAVSGMSTSVQGIFTTMSTQTASTASQMMNTVASSITSGASRVTSSATGMSTSVQNVFKTMSTQSQNTVTQMMTSINSTIVSKTATIKASITSMGNGITTALNTAKTQAVNIVTQMMTSINSVIISRTSTVRASVTAMVNAVITALNEMPPKGESAATKMMTDINSAIVSRTATVKSSATAVANGVVDSLEPMVSGAEKVTNNMMDGIRAAMERKAQELYSKAREIANRIAETMASALDVHSPSRVMIRLFEYVMLGIYEGMDGMSGRLYREADEIADGLVDRLTIDPDMFGNLYDRLRSMSSANPLGGAALVPQAALAGAAGGLHYSTNLTQNITTPKPLSPSEMTREGQDMLRRSRWLLP